MEPKELEILVTGEYWRLNVAEGRVTEEDLAYKAPEQLRLASNQIRALINIVALLLPDLEALKGGDSAGTGID